jgi:hypothetical protein
MSYSSLVDQKAVGLFFRPRVRGWLASSSYIEGWKMYWNKRALYENIHACAPRSYFGMDIMPFSTR